MAPVKRQESQAQTRERLLAAARELFRHEGYAATSVQRIAKAAGFSKGALYANFASKEAIFIAVLTAQGQTKLNKLLAQIDAAAGPEPVIELLVDWAQTLSRSGSWALTILEHVRLAQPGTKSVQQQKRLLRDHWQRLGGSLLAHFPGLAGDAETLGALLHEIAYAPAITFMKRPCAGDLMRMFATSLFAGYKRGQTLTTKGTGTK